MNAPQSRPVLPISNRYPCGPTRRMERVHVDTIMLPFKTGPDLAQVFLTVAVDEFDGQIVGYSLEVGSPSESIMTRLRNCLSNALSSVEVRNG